MCSIKSSTHALIAAVGQFGAGYKFRRVAVLAVGGRFWGRPKLKLEELDFPGRARLGDRGIGIFSG